MLSKIPICIDILDESVDEAFPINLGESNHIPDIDSFHQQDTFGINDDVPPNNPTRNVHQQEAFGVNGSKSNETQSGVNGSKVIMFVSAIPPVNFE